MSGSGAVPFEGMMPAKREKEKQRRFSGFSGVPAFLHNRPDRERVAEDI